MSKKFTKSQIEKIISEEISNILIKEVKGDQIIDLLQGLLGQNILNKAKAATKLKNLKKIEDLENLSPEEAGKLADDVSQFLLVNGKNLDEDKITKINKIKNVLELAARNGAPKGISKKIIPVAVGAAAAAGTGAYFAADGDAVSPGDARFKDTEFKDMLDKLDIDIEKFKNLPSKEKKKLVKTAKKLETPKERRTRIAHDTVKGKDKVESVKKIQKLLQKLGYDLGKFGLNKDGIDGDYGDTTVKAVKAFQESNGLIGDQADGIVGNNTWKILNSKEAKGPSPAVAAKSASKASKGEAAELLGKIPSLFGKGNEILNKIYKEKADKKGYMTIVRLYIKFRNKISQRLQSNARANDIDSLTRVIALNKALPRQGQVGVGPGKTGETDPHQISIKLLSRIGKVLNKGLVMLGNIHTDDPGSIAPAEAYKDFFTVVFNDPKLKPIFYGYASDSIEVPELPTPPPIDDPGDSEELEESKKYNLNFDKWSKLWE